MKKLLVVLLSLGLIAAFSMTAFALDFKLGGSYKLRGGYIENPNLLGDNLKYSRHTLYTRVRMQPVLVIDDGLSFTMRFDALEKKWGDTTLKGYLAADNDDSTSSRRFPASDRAQAGSVKIQENIEFERGFVTFRTQIGQFDVGYQQSGVWGTKGLQQDSTRPRVKLTSPFGPLTLLAIWEKRYSAESKDNSSATAFPADGDNDNYNLAAVYKTGFGEMGLLYQYSLDASQRPSANYKTKVSTLAPYFQGAFGNFFVEAEVMYFFGKAREYDTPTVATPDIDLKSFAAFAHAKLAMGPAYAALQFNYTQGTSKADLAAGNKTTTYPGFCSTWTPALMLMSDGLSDLFDSVVTSGSGGQTPNNHKRNSTIYNAYAGYFITPRLNVEANVTYALATEKALTAVTEAVSDKMGTEIDLSMTYRIYDNLTYHIAAGYLWTGDYFKGANAAATVGNAYMLFNNLTLSF